MLKLQSPSSHVWIGLVIRLLLAWLLPALMDDEDSLLGGIVAYTDIDYHVYCDAASYIQQGLSPYRRHTYRYTPFLAALLSKLPEHRLTARFLFCITDTLCGWIIQQYRRRQRLSDTDSDGTKRENLIDALYWLYNPLAINICTRGSAESLVLLPVLVTVWIATQAPSYHWSTALEAGMWHGLAIHAKLYPIIYSLAFATHFAVIASNESPRGLLGNELSLRYVWTWFRRLALHPRSLIFCLAFVSTFCGLTYLSLQWYGREALDEGLLYHFSRVDHRHNYSMHWYWIYLARGDDMAVVGRLLLLPQAALLLLSSLVLAPRDLTLALFVQTFCFVAQNKVITAQYFTWYLCLLPLCSDQFAWTRAVQRAVIVLIGSMALWLGSAYCLEMQGMAMHRLVWLASLGFFAANVNLLRALLGSSSSAQNVKRSKKVN